MHRVPLKWAIGILILMVVLAIAGGDSINGEALWPVIGINALLIVGGLIISVIKNSRY